MNWIEQENNVLWEFKYTQNKNVHNNSTKGGKELMKLKCVLALHGN